LDEEIYILIKHANFDANYIENIPIYRRRHFLYLFNKENEKIQELQENEERKHR